MSPREAIYTMRSLRTVRLKYVLIPPVCVGLIIAAVLVTSTIHSLGADLVATNPPAEMAVTVTKVKNACFSDTLVVMGNLVPQNEVLVRPDREGMVIKEILVESGKSVNAGQALARLAAPNDSQGSLTSINAPVSGIILAAPTVVGETVSARGDPLFRILGAGDLDLLADVPAKEASRLAIGQVAKIKVAGVNELPGKVRLVSTTVDPTTQLGKAHIAPDHNSLLRVGAFARATITVGQACGVAVPLSALLFGPDGSVIQTIRDDRVETRRVTVGLFAQNDVQIREGLTEGDMIVVRSGAFLRDGDRVRAVVADE
jgi:multidrug efflux pump subunit AcrA (membrane-fusion protein)